MNKKILVVLMMVYLMEIVYGIDRWNRLVQYESTLTLADYSPLKDNNTQSTYNSFSIQLFSNHTFVFVLHKFDRSDNWSIDGNIVQNHNFSINSHTYTLQNEYLSGTVQHQINKGLKWTYHIIAPNHNITTTREQITSSYVNQLALLLFGILGVIILPLSDSIRNKMLYNIRKRTHPIFSYFILLKLTILVCCFMVNCYYFITNSPWYYIFITYGVYLFMISPSIIHAMYFITSIQRQLKNSEWFKQNNTTVKCIIMSLVILSIPILAILLVYVEKGVIFFYICSVATVYQYLQACRSKRYSFGKVLMYDLLITGIMGVFSCYMPSLNFTVLTYKQQVLFWNYYLGMFIFGILVTRIIIKNQIAEQIYLEQNNDSLPVEIESQRCHQLPKIQTNQVLQL